MSLIPQHLHHQPDRQATRIAAFAAKLGFEALRQDNRDSWTELWRGRIHLVGASRRWQALTDASFFYLNSCAHGCSPASTGIFGLAEWHDYHYYYGHVMWDLETFMFPVLLLMQPFAARSILDYRTDCLDAARRNARLNGYRGIQFPWESGTTRGEESAPGAGTAAWHEDHVSADVALAFVQYAHATGDDQFSQRQAWPVLNGVADWIASRVMRTDDGFTLRRSMGIAERKTPSDNAAFTVMGMKRVLREAMAESERHLRQVPPEWAAIERGLDLPMNRSGAIVSYDGYRRADEKSATPDPLAGLLLLGYDVDSATERATLKYFLARAQEYIGSPMLSALYGVWAAWAGDRRLSAKLLDEGFGDFAADRFTQILEYRPDRFADETPAGPFMANIGGFLTGCLYGFAGLRVGAEAPDAWPRRPVILPSGWKAIEVERIWARGHGASLTASHGAERAIVRMRQDGDQSAMLQHVGD